MALVLALRRHITVGTCTLPPCGWLKGVLEGAIGGRVGKNGTLRQILRIRVGIEWYSIFEKRLMINLRDQVHWGRFI
jgi:hypothetical protein